jgi:two-component system nitrate/nitrite response regulator NarL
MFREALHMLLSADPDLCIVGEAADGERACTELERCKPDVLLLDLNLHGTRGLDVLRRMSAACAEARAIVLDGTSEKHQVIDALVSGARGILSAQATPEMLFKCIRSVAAGEYWVGHENISVIIDSLREESHNPAPPRQAALTPRERDVVTSIVDGETNKGIAHRYSISEQTVKHHLTSIFGKTGATNRLELALYAMHQNL